MSDHKKSARKRKRESGPPQSNITKPSSSSTYADAFKEGTKLFQDITDAHPKPSRRTRRKTSEGPSRSSNSKGPTKSTQVVSSTWRLDKEAGTFVTVVPVHKTASQPRPAISKPRYHRPVQRSTDSRNEGHHASLFSSTMVDDMGVDEDPSCQPPSPVSAEHRFSVQYPTYARSLDHFSVEQKVSRHARRRIAAAHRWDRDIIPSMIHPYMEHARQSKWGQSHIEPASVECSCDGPVVFKVVTTVYMDRLSSIELRICSCPTGTAPVQLVKQGLFPCSPVHPALAISLDMLEFAATLFVHLAPNETAWCDALTMFLSKRGHVFETKHSLRRRFGTALHQYQLLIRVVDAEMDKQIGVARREVLSRKTIEREDIMPEALTLPMIDVSTPVTDRLYVSALSSDGITIRKPTIPGSAPNDPSLPLPATSTTPHNRNACTESAPPRSIPLHVLPDNLPSPGDPSVHPPPVPKDPCIMPSDYLRSRCPLCAGAGGHAGDNKLPELFICIDACFTLRRNKDYDRRPGHKKQPGTQDPRIVPPGTREVPRSFLETWKARVEAARSAQHSGTNPGPPKRSKKGEYTPVHDSDEDVIEPGLRVPNSSLDTCGESFVAADGNRVKTPGEHFSDTGVIAAVCRHDRVIVYASMWTPGEQQFYALALIDVVMAELPQHWRVGILYDVGCQIHRSILKWDLLPQWVSRIQFAISVFHAYGHQWVCQLWYHPRKGGIWGLTDGEGCERLWSDLRRLIPNLRVAGYHRRLFILDLQIEHLDNIKLPQAGVWLERRVKSTTERLILLEKKRAAIAHSDKYLWTQFEEQRAYQSRPLERQSKKKGFHAVEKILAVRQRLNAARDLVEPLRQQLIAAPVSDSIASRNEVAEITSAIAEQEKIISRLSKQNDDLTATLQLGDPVSFKQLEKMKHHAWFEHQLNMRALKARIIAKVCEKNFETHNLTGAFRSKAVDHNTLEHTSKVIKRRYRSVKGLVTEYNNRRESMKKLRGRRGIPQNAIIPPPINMKGLFDLDVDNDIWQDIGLADDEFNGNVPPWLGDETVRNGIRLVQEITNCRDELDLCMREKYSLQHWFDEESATLLSVLHACTNENIRFFLLERIRTLCSLGKIWGRAIDNLAPFDTSPDSGPPTGLLLTNAGLLEEHRQTASHARPSFPVRIGHESGLNIGSDVDSSDDGEDLELEPAPILADAAIIAASDLIHQEPLDGEGTEDDGSSSSEDDM